MSRPRVHRIGFTAERAALLMDALNNARAIYVKRYERAARNGQESEAARLELIIRQLDAEYERFRDAYEKLGD